MTTQISKRALTAGLTAGLGASALALLAQTQSASADTPFSTFAFPATGSPTARTMPARLSEIKNVKDFGAVGNGIADDTAAIQNAVDWTTNVDRGVIFFPPGQYFVSSPITFNYDGEISIIFRGVGKASMLVGNFAGYILDRSTIHATGGERVIEDLEIVNRNASGGCIRLYGGIHSELRNCRLTAFIGANVMSTIVRNIQCVGPNTPGSIGIYVETMAHLYSCDVVGFEHGARVRNGPFTVMGSRFEVNSVGLMLGMDSAGVDNTAANIFVGSSSFEANGVGIYLYHAVTALIGGVSIQGSASAPGGQSQYGVRVRAVDSVNIYGLGVGGNFSTCGFSLEAAPYHCVFSGVVVLNSTAGAPTWSFSGGGKDQIAYLTCLGCNNPALETTFGLLPKDAVLGDSHNISDSTTGAWGAIASGGGAYHVLVRYNGSSWIVIGI
jgi:hypothetical protein